MIEEFAVWLGCNPSLQDPTLCAVNTLLIAPGIIGLSSVLILYLISIPILALMGLRYLFQYMTDKLRGKR